jgi:hypothetical protein
MMNQRVWCDFWPRLISQLFSRCSTRLRGINHSKVRCPVLTRANFANTASLEEKFRDYASKDFGTSLQQASNE